MRPARLIIGSWHVVNLVLVVWTVWVGWMDRRESATISTAMALDGAPWVNVMGLVAWG